MLERFIHVHIEKTAGTSLRTFFEKSFGLERVVIFYAGTRTWDKAKDNSTSKIRPMAEFAKKYLKNTRLLFTLLNMYKFMKTYSSAEHDKHELSKLSEEFLVLCGHYLATEFDDVWPQAKKGVVIREPLQRIASQYSHWKRTQANVDFRIKVPFDPHMSFEEYALLTDHQNYQTAALDGKPLSSFDFIGVTEEVNSYASKVLAAYCHVLPTEKRNISTVNLPNLNVDPSTTQNEAISLLSDSFKEEFSYRNSEDYKLYEAARDYQHV